MLQQRKRRASTQQIFYNGPKDRILDYGPKEEFFIIAKRIQSVFMPKEEIPHYCVMMPNEEMAQINHSFVWPNKRFLYYGPEEKILYDGSQDEFFLLCPKEEIVYYDIK